MLGVLSFLSSFNSLNHDKKRKKSVRVRVNSALSLLLFFSSVSAVVFQSDQLSLRTRLVHPEDCASEGRSCYLKLLLAAAAIADAADSSNSSWTADDFCHRLFTW